MGWAVDAYKAQQAGQAEQTNAIANATNVILQDRAKQRADWLKQLELESQLGDVQRNELRQKLANGFGLTGFVKNMFGANSKGYNPVANSMEGSQGGSTFTQQEQVPLENRKEKELLYGGESAGLGAKLETLKKTNPAAYKAEIEKINAGGLTQGKISSDPTKNPYVYDENGNLVNTNIVTGYGGKNLTAVNEKVSAADIRNADKIAKGKTATDIAQQEYKNLQSDQALSDKTIDAENRVIDQRNKIAKKKNDNIVQASGSYKSDPNGHIAKTLMDEGLFVKEYTGSFSNMVSQATNMYQRAIDIAVKNGDYNTAEKLNRKYKVDMYSIHKNWLDKPQMKDIEDLFKMPKGGKGEKAIEKTFTFYDPESGKAITQKVIVTNSDLLTSMDSPQMIARFKKAKIDPKLYKNKYYHLSHDDAPVGTAMALDEKKNDALYYELLSSGQQMAADGSFVYPSGKNEKGETTYAKITPPKGKKDEVYAPKTKEEIEKYNAGLGG